MGSIQRRVRNGRVSYRARYRDPAGRQRSRNFGRKVDAERFLTETEGAKLRGAYIDPRASRTSLAELAERWWETTASLKPSTRATYRKLLDGHVLLAFGGVEVGPHRPPGGQ